MRERSGDETLYAELWSVPGCGPGTAIRYLYMLVGAKHLIKPDRMVFRFLAGTLGRPVSADEAQALLGAAAKRLQEADPTTSAVRLTMRSGTRSGAERLDDRHLDAAGHRVTLTPQDFGPSAPGRPVKLGPDVAEYDPP